MPITLATESFCRSTAQGQLLINSAVENCVRDGQSLSTMVIAPLACEQPVTVSHMEVMNCPAFDRMAHALRHRHGAGVFMEVNRKSGMQIQREQREHLPASTAGVMALIQRHQLDPLPGDRHVAVLAGRRA